MDIDLVISELIKTCESLNRGEDLTFQGNIMRPRNDLPPTHYSSIHLNNAKDGFRVYVDGWEFTNIKSELTEQPVEETNIDN